MSGFNHVAGNKKTLDDLTQRGFIREDPKGFIMSLKTQRIILDEIQYEPDILSYIKIDVDNKSGKKWVLTGSQHFELMKGVRESLAGRVALLELPPFSLEEYTYTDL